VNKVQQLVANKNLLCRSTAWKMYNINYPLSATFGDVLNIWFIQEIHVMKCAPIQLHFLDDY
jgi:hypothetical protein